MERNHWSATRRCARRSPKRGCGISGFQAACDGLPGFAALDSSLICSSIKGGDKKTATEAGVQRQFWYCFQETMIKQIQVSGYRSIRELALDLKPINVLTGPKWLRKIKSLQLACVDRTRGARAIGAGHSGGRWHAQRLLGRRRAFATSARDLQNGSYWGLKRRSLGTSSRLDSHH